MFTPKTHPKELIWVNLTKYTTYVHAPNFVPKLSMRNQGNEGQPRFTQTEHTLDKTQHNSPRLQRGDGHRLCHNAAAAGAVVLLLLMHDPRRIA